MTLCDSAATTFTAPSHERVGPQSRRACVREYEDIASCYDVIEPNRKSVSSLVALSFIEPWTLGRTGRPLSRLHSACTMPSCMMPYSEGIVTEDYTSIDLSDTFRFPRTSLYHPAIEWCAMSFVDLPLKGGKELTAQLCYFTNTQHGTLRHRDRYGNSEQCHQYVRYCQLDW